MEKVLHKLLIRFSIVIDFFKTLWKYKMWWSFPLISLMLIIFVLLFIAGHSGAAALIYPLF